MRCTAMLLWSTVAKHCIYISWFSGLTFLNPRRFTISSTEVKGFKYKCFGFLCHICGLISLNSWLFWWYEICWLVQVLFLPHSTPIFLSSIWQIHNTKSVVDHYIRTDADDLKFPLRMEVNRDKWKLVKFCVQLTTVICYNNNCRLVYRISNERLILTLKAILLCS